MGPESQEREATQEEISKMCDIVREAMRAGALGISSSYVDIDENGDPVPSRFAGFDEKAALAQAMGKRTRNLAGGSVLPRHETTTRQYQGAWRHKFGG